MKLLRGLMVALLAAAAFASGAMASSTTNFSDQWWIEAERGWGASVLQQHDVLFIDLFVYDANSSPTWFTAAAFLQGGSPAGHTVFTGDLNRTTGPYYAGGTYDPNAVRLTRVGTLTFDATSATTAVMTYTVDGTQVVKNVTRQLWRYENIGGVYVGGMADDEVCGSQASERVSEQVIMDVRHGAGNAVSIALQILSPDEPTVTCTITGTYSQSGHMGEIPNATGQCMGGTATGTFNFFEIERSVSGLLARFNAVIRLPEGTTCTLSNGYIGGVRKF